MLKDERVQSSIEGVYVEEKKVESEEELIRLSNAMKMSTDSIVISNIDGKIIDVNETTLKMYGTNDKRDLIGKNSFDLIAPEERERALAGTKEVLEKGYLKSREYHVITKDGSRIPVEMSVAIMKDVDGKPIGFVGISRDISERKRAEEALRRSEEQARRLLEFQNKVIDTAIVIIDIVDREGNITLWNRAAELITGYSRKEVIGHKKLWEWLYPDPEYRAEIFGGVKKTIETGEIRENFHSTIKCKDGTLKTISWHSNGLQDEKGETIGLIGVGIDITDIKRAQEKIRESEEKFRSIFENATDCMIYLDKSGRILDVNRKAVEVFGGAKNELLGKNFTRLGVLSLKDIPRLLAAVAKGFAGKEATLNVSIKNKRGQKIHLECSNSLTKTDGKLAGLLVIARDITERNKAEERIRESEERYRVLVESAADAIFTLNEAGDFLSANQEAATSMGKAPEDIVGKNMCDLFPRDIADSQMKSVKAVFQTGAPHLGSEALTQTKFGLRWYSTTLVPVRDSYGKILYAMGIARDITEHKKMEETLRKSENKSRTLLENLPQKIFFKDLNSVYITCNENYARDLKIKSAEITGKTDYDFHPKRLADKYRADDKRIMESVTTEDIEEEYIQDGQKVFVQTVKTPVKDDNGNVVGVLGIFWDISERKKMERKLEEYSYHLEELVEKRTRQLKEAQEQLLKSERLAALGEVATMVGHDLRNPLQSIENATYYLNSELPHLLLSVPNHKKAMEMLKVLSDSVNYADKIIRDLQDFAAIKKPILKKTNINTIVKETLSQVKTPDNIELITKLSHLPEIKVDKDMIKRVFTNLTTNGIQAMENGGTLTVTTMKTKESIEVSFKDTGTGMPKENMKKIFIPFFTTKAKGMGMGLPICKRFVESLGGSIEVESEEGKGATFTVKLPIQQLNGGENQ